MYALKTVSVMALVAGTAFALPAPAEEGALVARQWWGGSGHWKTPVWVTVTEEAAAPASTPTPSSAAPAVDVVTVTSEASTPTATWAAAAPATPTASSSSSSSSSTSSSSSSTDGYMAIVAKWRSAGGLPALTQDSTLEANALKTSTASVGGLIHELNPGTMAQVLAPGTPSNFESVYVGGWLCEEPDLPGLDGICATEAQGWDHSDGETGHAAILTSLSYSSIGCALASSTGVWACDLA